MPRLARLDARLACVMQWRVGTRCFVSHHNTGYRASENIFKCKDREDFLERLTKLPAKTETSCYPWRVAEVFGMEKYEIFSRGRQLHKAKAKSPLCFWAVREAGMSLREVADNDWK